MSQYIMSVAANDRQSYNIIPEILIVAILMILIILYKRPWFV